MAQARWGVCTSQAGTTHESSWNVPATAAVGLLQLRGLK